MQKFHKIIQSAKIIIVLVLLYILGNTSINAQDLYWKANFTGLGNNMPGKSAIDSENNIYIIGTFSNNCTTPNPILTTNGGNDIAISKYDANGNHIWTRQIGGSSGDLATGLQISPDGQYVYITGYFQNSIFGVSSTGATDGFLAKYKSNGERVWFKNIAGASVSTNQRPNEIKIDKNNNLIIAGWFFTEAIIGNSTNNFTLNTTQPIGLFVAKFDTSGNVINAKKIETTNSATKLYTFDIDTSGYYLSGYYKGDLITDLGIKSSNNNSIDLFVYKIDYNFNGKGIITVGGSSDDYLTSCSIGDNGFFYFGGYFSSPTMTVDSTTTGSLSKKVAINKTSDGKSDIFFAKYKYDGTLQWFNTAGSIEDDILYRALYNKGNFIAAGQYGAALTFNNKTIVPKNNADAFAIVQNQYDNLVYLMPFGGVSGTEIGETAVVDNNGNFVVIGDYTSDRIYLAGKDSLDNSNPGTKDMFIAKFDKASLDSMIVHPTCPGSATGSITLNPTGTLVDPIGYAWTKDGDASFTRTTQNVTGLTAGTYRVTFTDAVGYSKSKSFILKDPVALTVTLASSTNVTCNNGGNGAIDISVTGGSTPYYYAWTTVGGSGLNAIVQDQTTLTSGQYSVSVTDKFGCPASLDNIPISQPNKVTFAGTVVTKINGSLGAVDLSVQGGTSPYSYLWSGASLVDPDDEQDISNITVAGNYTVTVTYAGICNVDTTVYIADSYVLNAYLGSKQNVLCKGGNTGSITIATDFVTGTPSYTWSPNVGNTATVSNLAAGSYSVTVTDQKPSSAIVHVTIAEPASALDASLSKTDITCNNANNGVLDANIAGGTLPYVYNWVKDAQPYDAGDETQINLSAGSYSVTVTDANNCTASASQTIVNPAGITFTGTPDPVTCVGGKNDGGITLSNIQGGTGTYTFLWNNGLTDQNINLLASNTYWVTVTDANNCSKSNSFFVDYEAPIIVDLTPTDITCNGFGNGMLSASVSGGHPGFTYQWSTGETTQSISNLTMGAYAVTVTDNSLCVKTVSAFIDEPAALVISSVNQNNVSCNGGNTGSLTLTVDEGTPQYTYNWDQGAGTSATATGLPAGTYNVTVTDANNCTINGSYTITEPPVLGLSEDVTAHLNPLCNGLSTGSITLLPSGGSGSYEYSMNSGAWVTNPVFSDLPASNNTFRVRDLNAITCMFSLSQTISITQPNAISIVSNISNNATTNNPWNGSINLVATGGTMPLSYTMEPGTVQQTTGDFTALAPGNYTVTVSDVNGCGPVISPTLTVSDATSISVVNGGLLKIYPNPAVDFIHIEFDGTLQNEITIALFSITGKLIFIDKVSSETLRSGNYRIDIKDIPQGMYILRMDNKIITEKIVIQ